MTYDSVVSDSIVDKNEFEPYFPDLESTRIFCPEPGLSQNWRNFILIVHGIELVTTQKASLESDRARLGFPFAPTTSP